MTTATAPAPHSAFDAASLDRLIAGSRLPAWASELRRAALDSAMRLGLPERRDENWMRTDLRLFRPGAWGPRPAPAAVAMPAGLLGTAIASGEILETGFDDVSPSARESGRLAGRLHAIDGHVVHESLDPAVAAKGVLFGSAERLLADHGETLRPHWFRVIDSQADWFAAMHAAFHAASAVLYVPAGVRIAEPLEVLSAITDGGVDTSHVLVVLGEGAEATVLTETAGGGAAGAGSGGFHGNSGSGFHGNSGSGGFHGNSGSGGFHCGGTEIVVGKNAFLRIVNLQNWNTGVWHVARQKAVVHDRGRLQWTLGALGSRLSQVAQDVALVGRDASAQVNGVMFTEGRQQLVYNTLQHHEAPSCKSDLLYKGALQDRSRLVWRGMIKVDKAAQKTDGYQRNDNLMLSDEARADSIPGLEIEADDVRCTHGATSGRVDAEQLFYAQARGLSADEAARLVVAGFFQQVFDRITIAPVREALARAIGSRIRRVR